MDALFLGVLPPSSGCVLSGSSVSEASSSCTSSSSVNLILRSCPVLRRRRTRGTYSEPQLLLNRRGRSSSRTMASSPVVAESRPKEFTLSHSGPPQSVKTGLWNSVSDVRIASLGVATALLASAFSENALAATEAVNENSNFMFVFICVAEAIALTGAAVGGILARQRKTELEKINAQLRQINVNLRRQSRLETYAPNLTYAPVGSGRMADLQVLSDPTREDLLHRLKTGKRWLREQKPANAYDEFVKALALAQQLNDTAEEKKAARGLGASCQRQGKHKEAIKYHVLVLDISKRTGENSGDTEAYGAIADCYTELGDLETAGKYYDRYIERLETDDSL